MSRSNLYSWISPSPRLNTILGAAGVVAAGTLATPCQAASVLLADGGRSDYIIVLPERPSAGERLAGAELAGYLKRMTGAELPVRETAKPPSRAIVLSARGAGAGQQAPEAYSIAVQGPQVRVTGARDRGLLFATYDLLDRLGCRFLAPQFAAYQGLAEVVPSVRRLRFELSAAVSTVPKLAFRKLYVEEGHSHTSENVRQLIEWMPKLRYNTLVVPLDYQGRGRVRWDNWRKELTPALEARDLIVEVGGHGYQNFLNAEMEGGRHFTEHPEWFGQDTLGKRRREQAWVFCTSNSEARKHVLSRFLGYVLERPEIRIFDFWPPDSAKWCECAPCKALGSPSDRQALLVNEVRREAARVRPDLRLEVLAYHTSIHPPEKVTLDREFLLDFCPISQCFEISIDDPASAQNAEYARGLIAWRKAFAGDISIYSYYRKYAWRSLLGVNPGYVRRDLEFYSGVPVQGVSSYAEPGDWAAYELNHYTLGHLAWDPAQPVEPLVERFCRARYGPEGAAAAGLLVLVADTTRRFGNIPGTTVKPAIETAAARQRLRAARDAYARRVGNGSPADHRLLLLTEYALRDLELQELRAAQAPEMERRAKIKELGAFLERNKDQGVFLWHSRLSEPRLLQAYGFRP